MDTLSLGVHYGLFDFDGALNFDFSEWSELVTVVEKVGKARVEEAKMVADYQAAVTANKLSSPLGQLIKNMFKILASKR